MIEPVKFTAYPNLPERPVKRVITGNYPVLISALHSLGTEVFVSSANYNLQKPVQKHADMSVLHLGDNRFITYDKPLADSLTAIGANCVIPESPQYSQYPSDISINCLIIDKFLVCNTKYCAREVLEAFAADGKRIIDVKQGYTRCSVAVVDSQSIITADQAIASKLTGEGFDVLKISPGNIELPGYKYGFIGGCCGKLSRNKILFYGDPATHPDGARIIDFIHSKNIEIIISARDNLLHDFGGIIQVAE